MISDKPNYIHYIITIHAKALLPFLYGSARLSVILLSHSAQSDINCESYPRVLYSDYAHLISEKRQTQIRILPPPFGRKRKLLSWWMITLEIQALWDCEAFSLCFGYGFSAWVHFGVSTVLIILIKYISWSLCVD